VSLTIGIDVGGTKIAGGVVDKDGTLLEEHRVRSPAADPQEVERAIVDLVDTLRNDRDIAAVGVGVAGYVDKARSVVMFTANMAVRDLDLRADLEKLLDLPVVVENDANAAAWGEFAFGAGADVDDFLLITIGTGVGAGIVLDGHLHRGAFGVAGEVGHMRVVPDGRPCGCGNRGCLEQYTSGTALVREARAAIAAGDARGSTVLDRAGGDLSQVTGPLLTQAARDGDAFAIEQLATLGRWLGEGIAALTAVLDPAVAVVGGGVSAAGDLLLEPAREAFADALIGRGHRPMLEIRPAILGNRAGIVGAADLARR